MISVRTDLRPGDIGAVVHLHGVLYAREYGFDPTFEAYVAGPLAEFVLHPSPRSRLWLAEQASRLLGCIAIVETSQADAQLRWYLVDPAARGQGLGKRLIQEAVQFCRDSGYQSVHLWTVNLLATAAHLYRSLGFEKIDENPGRCWGVDLVEEKYHLHL